MSDIGEKLTEKELCPDDLLRGQEAAFQQDIERLQTRIDEFLLVVCPACGSSDHRFTFQKHRFNYVTCGQCRTLFMNPRPSPEVMEDYYSDSENYRYWAKYIFPASEEARRDKIHKPRLERVVEYCRKYGVVQGVLMEVGAGFGTFSRIAQESGRFKNVFAVEPTPEMAQACRERGVNVIQKRIEELGDSVEAPDIVVSFEVVEHLFEPRRFLDRCAQLMKPGGLLVISCPNCLGFDISMLGGVSLAIDPEHINLFNPDSLSLLVRSCGFDVLEVTTPGRLDAEFVRAAIEEGKLDISADPFLKRVIVEEWDRLGWPFQQFLAQNGLSSHMWLAGRKT